MQEQNSLGGMVSGLTKISVDDERVAPPSGIEYGLNQYDENLCRLSDLIDRVFNRTRQVRNEIDGMEKPSEVPDPSSGSPVGVALIQLNARLEGQMDRMQILLKELDL